MEAFEKIQGLPEARLILPAGGPPPSGSTISRFMAKVALESMAARIVSHAEGLDYLCDETQLDDLRNHARRGSTRNWPVHARRIYSADAKTFGPEGLAEQVVHESDFLVTNSGEWYFVLAIFGLELSINLAGPEIDGYLNWLKENGDVSPLYSTKNRSAFPIPS